MQTDGMSWTKWGDNKQVLSLRDCACSDRLREELVTAVMEASGPQSYRYLPAGGIQDTSLRM